MEEAESVCLNMANIWLRKMKKKKIAQNDIYTYCSKCYLS